MKRFDTQQLGFFGGVAALALLGGLITDSYLLHILILCLIWVMVVSAWDLVMGYAGILNFAQLAFFAVGAYAMAMANANLALEAYWALPIAALAGAVFGLMVGLPCLRLRGEYIALFTFAVHLALPPLIQLGRARGEWYNTGGATGLTVFPPVDLVFISLLPQDRTAWFFVTLTVAALVVYGLYFGVLRSRWGRAFVCLRDSEAFAKSLGVDDFKYKLLVFTVSATVTAVAGALYAAYIGTVRPTMLGNEFFLMVMLMLSIGGLGRFPGAVLGAFVIVIGNEVLREFDDWRLLILGLAVVIAILVMPGGIAGLADRLRGGRGQA